MITMPRTTIRITRSIDWNVNRAFPLRFCRSQFALTRFPRFQPAQFFRFQLRFLAAFPIVIPIFIQQTVQALFRS